MSLQISIHAPHTGRDLLRSRHSSDKRNFNPRAPYGARQLFPFPWFPVLVFQSTRPIRGATLRHQRRARRGRHFNPRAPYGARLFTNRLLKAGMIYFNPRAPYGARRLWRRGCGSMRAFQSTRPIRGATPWGGSSGIWARFQSTRPIRGATDIFPRLLGYYCISIHAPHTGRDHLRLIRFLGTSTFQSTRPIRGATCARPWVILINDQYFNPRAPYGARPSKSATGRTKTDFNPRAPYGARRVTFVCCSRVTMISIHAPHTGRDREDAHAQD